MASLQASLRGQRLSGPPISRTLMTNLNLPHPRARPENRYATFFYGELDPAARRLDYVNAGHNAPMIFRASAATSSVWGDGAGRRSRRGGPFEQQSVPLCPGDVLVVYSDGISEAMNAADEEWGEERLAASVREAPPDGAATSLIAHLFVQADAFAAGAVQHDDMTLVVVRCD
jgi:sigma-B regulation protein RsbU (phosphoserine phosphatase)